MARSQISPGLKSIELTGYRQGVVAICIRNFFLNFLDLVFGRNMWQYRWANKCRHKVGLMNGQTKPFAQAAQVRSAWAQVLVCPSIDPTLVNLYYQVKKYRSLCKGPCIGNVADTWGDHFFEVEGGEVVFN